MTIDEVAADPEIELVVNLTGPTAHYSVIRQMLLAGKNVYTEKMFTTKPEEAEEPVRIADEKHLYLGVAPDTVLGAGVQTAKRIIDSGLIGDVASVQARINRNQSLNSEKFRFLRRDGGALPYDVGIYCVGTLLTLPGPVAGIRALLYITRRFSPPLILMIPGRFRDRILLRHRWSLRAGRSEAFFLTGIQ